MRRVPTLVGLIFLLTLGSSCAAVCNGRESARITDVGPVWVLTEDGRRVYLLGVSVDSQFEKLSTRILDILTVGQEAEIEWDSTKKRNFAGHLFAYLYVRGVMLNKLILRLGLGPPFFEGKGQKYHKELVDAARQAHSEHIGWWTLDRAFGYMIKEERKKEQESSDK